MKRYILIIATILMHHSCIIANEVKHFSHTYIKTSYTNTTAQGVANIQASKGILGHHGGNSGYEGVGYSTSSPESAIRNCCYWGQKTPVDIGVAYGKNGWYACVRYK
jgi:hypothetical protein